MQPWTVIGVLGGTAQEGSGLVLRWALHAHDHLLALGVVRHYGDWIDGWVTDQQDARLQRAIEQEGKTVLVTDTVMHNRSNSTRLAKRVVAFAQTFAAQRR